MTSLDLHEKANFTRLSRLLVDKGTEALRNTFDAIHSPANLPGVLSANKLSLLKLKPRVINDSQWHLLYPPSGDPPDSKTFDVTLLTVLFRNICGLPKTGWAAMPVGSDRSMQANIVRIRLLRNEVYAHVTSTQVDNATFESLWKKISQALVDLNISQKDIDELKTCPLGPREEECLGILQDWKLHEEESLIMLEGLNKNVKSLESSLNRLTQISEENRDVEINRSKEKDEDLLQKLAKHNFKSKIRSKVEFFLPGTREWLLKKVNEWFTGNEHKSRVLLLTAGPGFGKSVFSARICEDFKKKRTLAGCHFCDFSDSNLRNPMMMLQSLASQMCENVVGFKEKLLDQLKRPHEVQNLRDAFGIYLQNPLDELELAEPVLIVIDGLDESAAGDKNEIVNLIAEYFPYLPKFIKVLVTSRPEISVAKLRCSQKINVDNSNADNNSDLKRYLRFYLPSLLEKKKRRLEKEDSGVFEKLVEICEGSFLYAFFVQSELQKRDDLDQMMPDEITEFLPNGLDSVYHKYFRRLEDELEAIMAGNFDVIKILEMLAASEGPLPLTFISRALGLASECRETKSIINKVNAAVSCLLYVSDDLVTVFHKSVVDWLLANGYNHHEYTVEVINGDRSLWIICEQVFEEIKKIVCSGSHLNLTNCFKYAMRHGLRHLTSCGMTGSYAWLVDVVIVYVVLKAGQMKNDILGLWHDFLRVNARIIDAKLRGRISWHIIELDNFNAVEDEEDQCYLASVAAHSPRRYFSEKDWDIARKLLSKYSSLVDINCKHVVEIIPRAVRLPSSSFFQDTSLSKDNSMAAVATIRTVTLVDLPRLDERWQYDSHDYKAAPCCTFAPDDSFILFGKLETALSVADGKEVSFFHNNKETFASCGFSPNGKRLVTSNGLRTIKLWDIGKQSLLSSLCTESPVQSCSFSSTGLFIIAESKSSRFRWLGETDDEDLFCVWNAVTLQRCDERNKKGEAKVGDVFKRCSPATFDHQLPTFKTLNVELRYPVHSWNKTSTSTGIFNGVECHFILDMHSLGVVENTHFTTLACWNIAFRNLEEDYCRGIGTIADNLWLCAYNSKLIVFETLVSTPKQCSCLLAQVYSSSFSPDSSRFATCTSDGFVNIWNVDSNQVDQRFKCSAKGSPFACWWSEKFLLVFHIPDGIPTLSKYPMNANLKLLLSQRDMCQFPAENVHLLTVVDFSEGLVIFQCEERRLLKVFDVVGFREVTLPEIEPEMRLTVSPRCSYILGAEEDMFYIWKRNGEEAPVYTIFFKSSQTKILMDNKRISRCCFSSGSKVAVVAYLGRMEVSEVSIHDLDTGCYKLVTLELECFNPFKLFCFNELLIFARDREINIFDMNTCAHLDGSKQRYCVKKFQRQMRLSPNGTTLAIPIINGDMEFIRLSIAQSSLFSSMKAKAVMRLELDEEKRRRENERI